MSASKPFYKSGKAKAKNNEASKWLSGPAD